MSATTYNMLPTFSLKAVRERGLKYPLSICSHQMEAVSILKAYLWDKETEHLVVLLLDQQNNFLGLSTVAIGGIAGVHTQCRDIYKAAILFRAAAIILSHNHPSGCVDPSPQDIDFTRQAVKAGKVLGIPIHDHIIVSSGKEFSYYSFAFHNLIQEY